MEEGFAIDAGDHSMPLIGHWHPGQPVKRWYGLQVDKKTKRQIVSWRCTGCGLLENYAP